MAMAVSLQRNCLASVIALDDDYLADTQSQTQKDDYQESQPSQNINEKIFWGRLHKKRLLRHRLGIKNIKNVVYNGEETDYLGKQKQSFFCLFFFVFLPAKVFVLNAFLLPN